MRLTSKKLRSSLLAAATLFAQASLLPYVHGADPLDTVQSLQREGRPAEALAEADRFLATDPQDARMRFLKAVLLADLGRTNEATELLQQLTQDYPGLAEPYNNLAALSAAGGDYGRARNALEHAVRLRPDYAVAHENLGDVYAALAAHEYAIAARLEPARQGLSEKLERARAIAPAPVASPASGASSPK